MAPQLIDEVIDNNYCVGCGICELVAPEHFSLKLNAYGMYEAERLTQPSSRNRDISNLCPMSGGGEIVFTDSDGPPQRLESVRLSSPRLNSGSDVVW